MNDTTANSVRASAGELDLLAVLETVIARSPRVLKSGNPNLAFLRAANAALAAPDPEEHGAVFGQVEFWLALASELGLAEARDGVLAVTETADEFFSLPAEDRLGRLRDAWLDARGLNEFALVSSLELPASRKGGTVDAVSDVPGAEALREARRSLCGIVADIADEMPVTKLLRRIETEHRNLFINHDEDGSWRNVFYRGIRERGARENVERDGNWGVVEGAVIEWMLAVPLSALGWIEYRGLSLAPPSQYAAPQDLEAVAQPNFEVVAMGDRPDASLLWRLARFTTPEPEGRVRKYRLERKPFTEALGRGHDPDELVAFLASLSRTPLPQNVLFSMKDWGAMSERIKLWPDALLVEAEGVEDLAKLLPTALLETLRPDRLPDGHYVCPAPDTAALKGLMPPRRPLLDYSRRLPPVVEPGVGLALRAPRESLHLRARQLLALISNSKGTDLYELEPDAVRASARALGAEALMARVREALARPLSAPVALALRTWSGEFPQPFAGISEILIAEHPDQAALIEELADVQRWVSRRLAPGVYLLRAGGAEQVKKALGSIRGRKESS